MTFYNSYFVKQIDGSIDLDTDTIKVMLLTSAYTPNADTHEDYADISANEVSGTGYTAGGKALTTVTITKDNTENAARFDADDVSWTSSTITARYAVLYKDSGVAGTSWLISYIDFATDKSSSSSTFQLQWDATNGIFEVKQAA